MKIDKSLVAHCRALVEKKLDWGESQHWTNVDFEVLSEKILEETNTSLSTSTLKRLWGRVKYSSTPQAATLNALARFAGYSSYRDFELAHDKHASMGKETATTNPTEVAFTNKASTKKATLPKHSFSESAIWSIGLIMGFALSLLIAFSLSKRKAEEQSAPARYSFSSRPVAAGIPNSVVFTFDVSEAKTDCLFVQQTWDSSKRFKITKDQHEATSIYYYPGFFRAKLTVDSTVVKQHKLLIKTDGWLPMVERQPVPVYFKPEECTRNGALGLSTEQLASRNIPMQPEVPAVFYYYVDELGNLSSENFTLETSVKNTFSAGSGACQKSQVVVLCENSMFAIPLSIPGCTSALDAFVPGKLIKGSKADLSKFGVDFRDWVELRLAVRDKAVEVFLDKKSILKTAFSFNAGNIIGVGYGFEGTGLVDYVRLYDKEGKVAFREEFSAK